MKKSLLTLALAASIAVPGVASADTTAYGFIDVSLVGIKNEWGPNSELNLTSTTSAFGLKGSEDLGDGLKAIYKIELQVDIDDRCNSDDTTVNFTAPSTGSKGCDAIVDRDQYVGLKGGFGKVVFGTTSSNYKQMGGKIDPFYRTPVQARGAFMQSGLHSGAGEDGGRMSSVVQYTTPKMGGISAVVNTTFSGADDEASGIGIRYQTKALTVWLDTLSGQAVVGSGKVDSAFKIGGKFVTGDLTLGAQFESVENEGTAVNVTDPSKAGAEYDVMYLAGWYKLDKNNTVGLAYGSTEDFRSAVNLGLWHALSKKTSVYVAYHTRSDDEIGAASSGANDDGLQAYAVGLRKKF